MAGKTIVYQLLPRLWGNRCPSPVPSGSLEENGCGHFSGVDDATLAYLGSLGVTHVWTTGVIRHATTEAFPGCQPSNPAIVKGRAGSPYAICDWYDVNPYLADSPAERMSEFRNMLGRIHANGMKSVIDFVPNHVSRDYGKVGLAHPERPVLGAGDDSSVHWSAENDFFYYPGQALSLPGAEVFSEWQVVYDEFPAKASGNCFSPSPSENDWYETVKINYCDFRTSTWDKMLDIVRFWKEQGVDGFRCDMVELVPWQFFKWMIAEIKQEYPDTEFIAEVYQKDSYRHFLKEVGFDLLYDKSGRYDTLRDIVQGHGSARRLTSCWQELGDLQSGMLDFLENHDEQRYASEFFAGVPSGGSAALCQSLLFNDSAFMVYNGQEIGERGMDSEGFSGRDGRTTIFDWWSPAGLRRLHEYVHSGKGLTASESECMEEYSSIFALASSISDPRSYDLCWCNTGSSGFNPDKDFAFLRRRGEGLLLFCCNFDCPDNSSKSVTVRIPPDAYSYFGLPAPSSPSEITVSVRKGSYSVTRIDSV